MNIPDFNLTSIASILEALEETIIFKLIDRAQFCSNVIIYQPGKSGFDGESQRSLFEIRLSYQEQMDALFGRFCIPEERPFNKSLPDPKRTVQFSTDDLYVQNFNIINLTNDILESYYTLIPNICPLGDDGQYGSSVENDIYAVQAISRRIHFGSFYIAESKYRQDPEKYDPLIDAMDSDGLYLLLTRKEVEDIIISRIAGKVLTTQSASNSDIRYTIDPEPVVEFYKSTIIPLTKKGQVLYLLNRKR